MTAVLEEPGSKSVKSRTCIERSSMADVKTKIINLCFVFFN